MLYPLAEFISTFLLEGRIDLPKLWEWKIPFKLEELMGFYIVLLLTGPTNGSPDSNVGDSIGNFCVIFIYSTFITSIWIWFYTVIGKAVNFAYRIDYIKGFLLHWVDLDKSPLGVLGWISIALLSIFYWGVYYPYTVLT